MSESDFSSRNSSARSARSSRMLVTGGAGFIGSNFVLQQLAIPDAVECIVNLDLLTYAGNQPNLAAVAGDPRHVFVQGDIGDSELVSRLLAEHRIDAVVNFAAESHVDRSIDGPEQFVLTNGLGTVRLLTSVRGYCSQLDPGEREKFRFLHVSTDEVYGTLGPDDPAFSEETPFAPNSPYAASKAASDHFVRAWHHTFGLPVLTTNCSNNYGPFQFPEKLIPLVTLNALEGEKLPIYGDGGNVRDWLYVEDHCRAIREVLDRGRTGETYNVGGHCERTNLEVVHGLCDLLDEMSPRTDGVSYREQIAFVTDRPGHDRRYAIDCAKITQELDWSPREKFETGLRQTVRWYLDHRDWCKDITARKYQRQRLGVSG